MIQWVCVFFYRAFTGGWAGYDEKGIFKRLVTCIRGSERFIPRAITCTVSRVRPCLCLNYILYFIPH